jgi:flagellar protein FliO/FliZ
MNRFMTLSRAAPRAAIPALGMSMPTRMAAPACAVAVACLGALACAGPAQAFTPSSKSGSEDTPLSIAPTTGSHTNSTGPSLVRTIVGLLIVIAVIWGLSWILRQVKTGRSRGTAGWGLASMATLPLGSGRSLHLVRAGSDYLLVGSAEQGVVPIYRYTEQQARDAGLLDPPDGSEDGDSDWPIDGASRMDRTSGVGGTRGRAMQIPGQAPRATTLGGELFDRLRGWTVRR